MSPALPSVGNCNATTIQRTIPDLAVVKEDEIRSALDEFLSDHCCYGSKPAKDLQITKYRNEEFFKKTFTERRHTKWESVPYNGEPIDGPNNGRSPKLWEIFVPPVALFSNETKMREVPHTEIVKNCHICRGTGEIRCPSCRGNGYSQCTLCDGRATFDDSCPDLEAVREEEIEEEQKCSQCKGTGRRCCSSCRGHREVKCNTCKGNRQLKWFTLLVVRWTNHEDNYISNETGVVEYLIKRATGSVAFEERNRKVYPLNNYPDEHIERESKILIEKHHTSFTMERILQQRQKVIQIPVAEVYYKWKHDNGYFYVYGLERVVRFDDYPQKCCWGVCTIL